jgi:ferredoxin-NADP reductase
MESPRRAESRSAILTAIHPVARDTNIYEMTLNAPLEFRAGQFINLAVPGAKPRGERSYSVYSEPAQSGRLDFVIKLLEGGAASEYLRCSDVGAEMQIKGPYGVFTLTTENAPIWFLATGTGLAPYRCMLHEAVRNRDPRPFRVFFGVRDQADLFGVEDLQMYRRELPDFEYTICLSRPTPGWDGYVGRITNLLAERTSVPTDHYYLCGNGPMIEEAKAILKERGLDRKHIHYEKFY